MVPWRQSASIMLLAKKSTIAVHGHSLFDYSALFLKRSSKMRFAPNISAFPGGKLDKFDLASEWIEYLSSSTDLDRFSKKTADIYKDIDHPYPGLAFRLCAIRETFEETGLLLAKSRRSANSKYSTVFDLPNDIVHQWRNKIRDDASNFLMMCKQIDVEPDINSLYDWSQYLAAAIAKVRFDTIFYVAPLSRIYKCSIDSDDEETVSAEWHEPDVAMAGYRNSSIDFLPPQVYELSRLGNFKNLSNLIEYLIECYDNPSYEVKRMLGICYKLTDAMLLVMPGDEFYPPDASFTTQIIVLNKTLEDFNSKTQNRLVMLNNDKSRKWKVFYKNTNENKQMSFNIEPLSNGWDQH